MPWYTVPSTCWTTLTPSEKSDFIPQEAQLMADDNFTLTTFYNLWKEYQERLRDALTPLTAEQLTLRAAPNLRSIGENATHIVGCRVGWFTQVLGESASEEVMATLQWDAKDAPARSAAELARGLDLSWQLMADCLARWTTADDMRKEFTDDWEGEEVHLSRAWIVWHVLEHDLSHGGEVSLILGIHGLQSGFTS